ncbi:hypothetical protein [Curvibacter delicatus]|jgi:hypothetical protein|uniref:hypothetical protein n=1 Tax=Curvibacter delicatus TaxID=80879 RepID=UPI00082E3BAB|nr:hypothetical protein [Curvibacter delicatus]
MKAVRSLITVSLMACLATLSLAAQPDSQDHEAHHPADAASAPKKSKAPAAKPPVTKPSASKPSAGTKQKVDQMDKQMTVMSEMHQKMMGAKTPEERSALMGEHMKVMQDGMSMMNMMKVSGMAGAGMGGGGMGGSGMGGSQDNKSMPGNMEDRQQMTEKRMDMMQMMMQMMMDTQSAPATK